MSTALAPTPATSAAPLATAAARRPELTPIGPKPSWQIAVEHQRATTGSDAHFRAVCTELMRDFPRLVKLCHGYLWQRVGSRANRHDAEDIAHTAVLQTAAVADGDDVHALFAHIAKCRAIDFARALRPVTSLDAPLGSTDRGDGHGWLPDLRGDSDYLAVEDRLESADLASRIRSSRLLTALQVETAEAVADCDGDVGEAAARLAVQYSTVTTRMYAARQALKTRMPDAVDLL